VFGRLAHERLDLCALEQALELLLQLLDGGREPRLDIGELLDAHALRKLFAAEYDEAVTTR
jgi:hypothetical protein